MTYLVDSHCHLADLRLDTKAGDSVAQLIARARRCGVTHFLSLACLPADFARMRDLTAAYPNVFLACGIHPLNLEEAPCWTEEELSACLRDPRVVALGETGIDYHYAAESAAMQKESFARQIALARQLRLPLVIHARKAAYDTLSLLRSENARDCGGVLHCFTDDIPMARACLDLGFYISFTGIMTFKAGDNVREVMRYVPTDRMMLETDSPYLSPVPVRGIPNEPAFVRHTLRAAAALLGLGESALSQICADNFRELFKVKLEEPPVGQLGDKVSLYKLEGIADVPLA